MCCFRFYVHYNDQNAFTVHVHCPRRFLADPLVLEFEQRAIQFILAKDSHSIVKVLNLNPGLLI